MSRRSIGPYGVVSVLGEGSKGTVYLAQRQGLERLFAVKRLHQGLDPETVQRFERGVRLATKIEHPYVVRPIDFGRDHEGVSYLAMEHIPGEDLRRVLQRRTRLGWREAANVVADVAEGLDAAHRKGAIHRDVRPSKIMLNRRSGKGMLLDFGLGTDRSEPSQLSTEGELIGGLVYSPPEVLGGERAESSADVYAAAVVLYELISGELPFLGRSVDELHQKALSGQRVDIRKHVSEVPRELEELLDRSLHPDPRKRPTAAVMARCLRDLGSVATAVPTAVLHAQNKGVPSLLFAGSVALWLLILGGIFAWGLSARRAEQEAQRAHRATAEELLLAKEQAKNAQAARARALERQNSTATQLATLTQKARLREEANQTLRRDLETAEREKRALEARIANQKGRPEGPRTSAGSPDLTNQAATIQALLDWTVANLKRIPGAETLRFRLLHNRGRYKDLLAESNGATDSYTRVLRGRTFFKLNRPQEALQIFAKVAKDDPDSAHGHFCRSLLDPRAPNLDLILKGIRRDPNVAYLRILLAQSLLEQGMRRRDPRPLEDAVKALTEAIRLDPTAYQAFEARAGAFMLLGQLGKNQSLFALSLEDYRRAYLINPQSELRMQCAEALEKLGKIDEAFAEAKTAIAQSDAEGVALTRVAVRLSFATMALAQKRKGEAVTTLREAAQVDPKLLPLLARAFLKLPPDVRRQVLQGLDAKTRQALGE